VRRKSITKRRREMFLKKLEASGSVTQAAIAGEISRKSWYELKARDAEFALAWDDAEMIFLDKLEATGIKRGVEGEVEMKPYLEIKGGDKRTRMRAVVTKSDRLLELTLKARHPSYKQITRVEQVSPDGSMSPLAGAALAIPNLSNLTKDEVVTITHLLRKACAGVTT
jgi:hypothetical protein